MVEAILDEIILHAVKLRKNEKIDLLTNAKAKEIAIEQGKIQGQTKFLSFLSQEFVYMPVMHAVTIFEDADDEPTEISKLSGEALAELLASMVELMGGEGWHRVMEQVSSKTEEIKTNLLISVNKSRTLYFLQGVYQGMICYEDIFDSITAEVAQREAERARLEKERASSLPFEENDGVNMVPHVKEATEDEDAKEEASDEDTRKEEATDGESPGEDIPGFDEREEAAS